MALAYEYKKREGEDEVLKEAFDNVTGSGDVLCLVACEEEDNDKSDADEGKSRKPTESQEEIEAQEKDLAYADEIAHVIEIALAEICVYDEMVSEIDFAMGYTTFYIEKGALIGELEDFPCLSEPLTDIYGSAKLTWNSERYKNCKLRIRVY